MSTKALGGRPIPRTTARVAVPVIALAMVLGTSFTAAASVDEPGVEDRTVEGTVLNIAIEDDGATVQELGDPLPVVSVVEFDDEYYELPDEMTGTLSTGDVVAVTVTSEADLAIEDALQLAAAGEGAEIIAVEETSENVLEEGTLAEGTVAHSLTVLPVYWSAGPSASTASLSTLATSARDYWSSQTGGQVAISSISVRDWKAVTPPTSCDTTAMMDLAASARSANGVGTPTSTSHVLVFFPQWSSCNWSGLATVGGGMIWINGTLVQDVLAHEFGHNLGLGHANALTCTVGGALVPFTLNGCTVREYRDYADVMGIGMANKPTGSLNAALGDHLGLVTLTDLTSLPSGGLTTDLAPLAEVSGHRALRVPVGGGQVYVNYRPAVGRDTRWAGWAGVQVHLKLVDSRGIPTSYLLNMRPETGDFTSPSTVNPSLPAGRSWTVPGIDRAVTVISTGSTARVSVTTAPLVRTQIFTDVPVNYVFYEEIRWLSEQGITTGLGDGSFGAVHNITREAMAVFLYRYSGITDYEPPTTARFWDVPVGRYFYTEISWLASEEITTGLGDGSFGALHQITREAMAAFLFRFAGETDYVPPATPRFPDVPLNHRFYREISWLAERGITNGLGDGRFGSAQSATRQEVAVFLYRLDRLLSF